MGYGPMHLPLVSRSLPEEDHEWPRTPTPKAMYSGFGLVFGQQPLGRTTLNVNAKEFVPQKSFAISISAQVERCWEEDEVKAPSSAGSALHGTGQCKPCAWFWKPRGCSNASSCAYCHLCPAGALKERKKQKVAAIRQGLIEPRKKDEK